jgi:hypothetical protein
MADEGGVEGVPRARRATRAPEKKEGKASGVKISADEIRKLVGHVFERAG